MKNLTNAEKLAVVKVLAGDAQAASKGLATGDHAVDVTVRVTGTITKGADFTQRIANKVDTWLLLGVALSKLNGATAESIVREAIAIEESDEADTLTKQVKEAAQEAILTLKGKTETPCAGKVTHDLNVVAVEPEEDSEEDESEAA